MAVKSVVQAFGRSTLGFRAYAGLQVRVAEDFRRVLSFEWGWRPWPVVLGLRV